MKALMYPDFGSLEMIDVSIPEPAEGELLIRVEACGICGSELETFKNKSPRRKPPLIMGHEFCGEVVEVGKGVDGWNAGDKLVSHAVVHCLNCDCCRRGDEHLCRNRQVFGMHRPGAFAEYVNVPARVAIPWPEGLAATAACLAEPLANGVHVARLIENWRPRRCLVIGAGPIGLMCQQALQVMSGVDTMVCDLSDLRLQAARSLGANETVNPRLTNLESAVMEWTAGQGVDCVVDAVGAGQTKLQSLALSRPGSVSVWLGLHQDEMQLKSYDLTLPERAVIGSYSARLDDLEVALELMANGQVDVSSWVGSRPLWEGEAAFRSMLTAADEAIKTVLVHS